MVGFYTDKIETCRPYVFVCKDALLMVHDTSQICLASLGDWISGYGEIEIVHYISSPYQVPAHDRRVSELSGRFGLGLSQWHVVPTSLALYGVVFSQAQGLVTASAPDLDRMIRDPAHERREAVNKLNDWFTPPRSQSAPLDIQYASGRFTTPPATRMTLPAMLAEVTSDARRDPKLGCIGVSALFQYGPLAGHALPAEFVTFVETHRLQHVVFGENPEFFDTPDWRLEVMERFAALSFVA